MKTLCKIMMTAIATMSLIACEKPEELPVDTVPADSGHALVLNEGTWGGNNASLSYIDLNAGTIENGWFAAHNNRGLGDVAQDVIIYGAKAYVTVWNSNSLEVVDTATGVSTHIDLGDRGPRHMAADGGKIYVSCYKPHSVIRIDTATLQVEATCEVGDYNPEGIAVVGNNLLVASSNISNEQGVYSYDNKVYAISIASFRLVDTIEVGSNPQKIIALNNNTAVVNYWGDYAAEPAGTAIITQTMSVTPLNIALTNMTVSNGIIYGYNTTWSADYTSKTTHFYKVDAAGTVTPILPSENISAYAIGIHPVSGNIYVADDGDYSANGDLHCFAPDGTFLWKREVGSLPSKILFF